MASIYFLNYFFFKTAQNSDFFNLILFILGIAKYISENLIIFLCDNIFLTKEKKTTQRLQ